MGGKEISKYEKAASIISSARINKTKLREIDKDYRPVEESESYRIQNLAKYQMSKKGFGIQVGYKIGCTTPVMQKYLNIHNPCAGVIFESTVHKNFGQTKHTDYQYPGVECEIAVSLTKDMNKKDSLYTETSVVEHVAAVMAAIEIVDDSWNDYHSVSTPSLIADNFFGAGCVLGNKIETSGLNLNSIQGSMKINNEIVGQGTGKDIMGNPFKALAWLANLNINLGTPLKSGDFVLLGSIVETKWVNKGDLVEIDIDKLGRASIEFN